MDHKNNFLSSFWVAITGFGVAIILFALSPESYSPRVQKPDNSQPQITDNSDFEIKLPDFLTQSFLNERLSMDAESYTNPVLDSSFDNIPSLKNEAKSSIPFFYIDQNYLHIGTFGFGHKYIPTNQTKIDGSMESNWLFRQSIYRGDGIDAFINLETNEEEKTIGYGLEYRF